MPEDQNSWPAFVSLFHHWWHGETPVGAVLLAFIMAALRMAYTGGKGKAILLEGALCGALTLTTYSALGYLSVPHSLAVAIGGGIGFIGVRQFHSIMMTILRTRFGGGGNAAK